ncbi:MAG TPA: replication-associated recombination protein A [Nitrospiria bacterium]|nr:replication-associated recombination protein A [Nitrospiria bacterium]
MRPRDFEEFVGQEHLLKPGKLLRRAIEADRIFTLILFGPPGCGKTALAHLIASKSNSAFTELNAVTSGVADLRKVIEAAGVERKRSGRKTLLLIDEIHRFNKSQQSALLPDLEKGNITLIGTSTQNPFFSIIPAISSRAQIVQMHPLSPDDLRAVLCRALSDADRGFGAEKVIVTPDAEEFLVQGVEGDARRLLNALEIGILTTSPDEEGEIRIDRTVAEESLQKKAVVYDTGDDHYDTISAFIKSMRGSDPDATVYWMSKMLYAGEDPLYIARRIVICASEDVGNADPRALVVATAALTAVQEIGMPEGRIPLAQAAIYIACAPKSNAAYMAIEEATREVETRPLLKVPKALRDTHYRGAKRLGHGEGYRYPHDAPGHHLIQKYLPEEKTFYRPTDQGEEIKTRERLERWRGKKKSEEP